MMQKVGICACYNTKNYGSMLQCMATQIVINKMGYESEFIIYKKKVNATYIFQQIPRLFNYAFVYEKSLGVKKRIELSKRSEIKKKNELRDKAFERFKNTYYGKMSETYYGYEELKANAEKYDTVLVGSDQLWSPAGLATNFYNLMFVPESVNKVSYATSFGVSKIPFFQKNRTRQFLLRINSLSVRENSGARIVKMVSGRDVEIVVDPTLLLNCNQWDELIPLRRIIDEPYLFCYFLGEKEEHRKLAKQLSHDLGLKIVTVPFLDTFVKCDVNFGDYQLFDVGPDDFVNLIRCAEYILTDSFHGSVFSMLYHKYFIVLSRYSSGINSRNSRIDSLLEQVGLEKRHISKRLTMEMLDNIDYSTVDNKLEALRRKSLDFLSDALSK